MYQIFNYGLAVWLVFLILAFERGLQRGQWGGGAWQ